MYETVLARLDAAGFFAGSGPSGCSPAEIAALEAACGFALPPSYRAFLAELGRGAGTFLRGTDLFYGALAAFGPASLREGVEALGPAFALPPRGFVFLSHQGYSYLWFDADGGDDPPVWVAAEGETAPQIVSPAFSAWLAGAADDEIALRRQAGV